MATGSTANYSFPYPLSTDPVNVSGDIEALANKIDSDLQEIVEDTTAAQWSGGSFTNGLLQPTYSESTAKFSMSLSQNLSASGSPSFVNLDLSGSVTSGTWSGDPINMSSNVSGILGTQNGGIGISASPSNGQLLIGNGSGFSLNTLIAGSNVTITNASGSVTIAAVSDSLPSQTGNNGKFLTTNGTDASWKLLGISDVTNLQTELNSKISASGGTFTGPVVFAAASASATSITIPQGTAPTSASNGDIWTTSEGLYVHIEGVTVGPIGAGGDTGLQDVLMFAGM
jgi:hypothetical protein